MIVLIPLSIFVFILLSSIGVYWLFFRPPSAASQRLELMGKQDYVDAPPPVIKESAFARMAERVADPINRLAPPSPENMGKLQKKLMYAGYRSPSAPLTYRAIQLLS